MLYFREKEMADASPGDRIPITLLLAYDAAPLVRTLLPGRDPFQCVQ